MENQQSLTIGILTDDGEHISAHFGRAQHVEVITLENKEVIHREQREKPGHHTWGRGHGHQQGSEDHRHEPGPGSKHAAMAEVLEGCQMVIARGMGQGAYQNLTERGMQPVLTGLHTISEAVQAVNDGQLTHQPERIHHKGNH